MAGLLFVWHSPEDWLRSPWGDLWVFDPSPHAATPKTLARFVEPAILLRQRNSQIKKGPLCGPFVIWYSLGDSNPCYRRERAAS